jgi:hypothetical protein
MRLDGNLRVKKINKTAMRLLISWKAGTITYKKSGRGAA